VGFGVTVFSIILQFIASVLALRIAISSRRLSLLPFALAILLMGLRRSYSLYSKLAFERPIDAGAESIALMISILMLVGLIGLWRSLTFPQDSPVKAGSQGFQFNLAKSAIFLGCIVILASSVIGFFSYSSSRNLLLETINDNNLTLARLVARQSELQADHGDRSDLLKQAELIWNQTDHPFKESYLCIIDSAGTLLLHSQMPQMAGQPVADLPLEKDLSLKPRSIGELAALDEEWSGHFTAKNGQSQVVSFVPLPSFDCLFAIHIPMEEAESAIRETVLPWAAALSIVTLLLLPLSLGLLYWSYSATLADVRLSEEETQIAQQDLLRHQRDEIVRVKASEEKYRTLVDKSPYCIHQINSNRQLMSMNRAGLQIMGEEKEAAILGVHYLSVVCGEDKERISKLMDDAFAGKFSEFEFRTTTKLWLSSTLVPIYDSHGKVDRLLGLSLDITIRKRSEEETRQAQLQLVDHQRHETQLAEAKLEELRKQLINHTRLATIGQMTASIAHEIRNPLGAIRNAAFCLKRRVPMEDAKAVQYVDMIDQEVVSADRVISDMLEMARSKEPIKELFDLSEVVRNVFDQFGTKESVQYHLLCQPAPFMIEADEGQIYQVLSNLVLNATQALSGNGEVWVELQRTDNQNLISIRDNGPGIIAEDRDQLFDPLFSTRAKGTGLGLTICRQIIERHGGSIDLQEHEGPGALFCVRIPRQAEDGNPSVRKEIASR